MYHEIGPPPRVAAFAVASGRAAPMDGIRLEREKPPMGQRQGGRETPALVLVAQGKGGRKEGGRTFATFFRFPHIRLEKKGDEKRERTRSLLLFQAAR